LIILEEVYLFFELVKFFQYIGYLSDDVFLFLLAIFNVTKSLLVEVVLQEQLLNLLELIL
jgi:hypothetical protein